MTPSFLYFDLGQVVLHFSRHRQYRQMAEVAGIPPERVEQVFVQGDLQQRYEMGQIDSRQVFDLFCTLSGTSCDYHDLRHAGSDIFQVNDSLLPVISQLRAANHRLGILSNTCPSHWRHCTDGRFAILPGYFEQVVLSYEVGAMKPAAEIYALAIGQAGVAPQEIFYADDLAPNVAGAQAAGIDAVQYTTAPALVAELRRRGVRFNY